jgi:tRNA(fMet)-specific endonuclease VapC
MKMTGNKFLLDTNIISAWLKGEKPVADKIDKAKEIHIPIIVVGELYYGVLYSTRVQKNIADIKT